MISSFEENYFGVLASRSHAKWLSLELMLRLPFKEAQTQLFDGLNLRFR
jgi:hypothetical protein